jgi:hypothetical protein
MMMRYQVDVVGEQGQPYVLSSDPFRVILILTRLNLLPRLSLTDLSPQETGEGAEVLALY